jgi:hypothetical protein
MQTLLYQSVPLNAIFPTYSLDSACLKNQLARLDKRDTLFLCAKLNLLACTGWDDYRRDIHGGQRLCLELMKDAGYLDESLVLKIYSYCDSQMKASQRLTGPISRAGLLELIRATSLYAGKLSPMNRSHTITQRSLLVAILTCAEYFSRKADRFEPDPNVPSEDMLDQVLPAARLMVEYSHPIRSALTAMGRAKLLLVDEFFGKNPHRSEEFKGRYGLTISEFMACAAGALYGGLFDVKERANVTSLESVCEFDLMRIFENAPAMQELSKKYLQLKAQSPEELSDAFAQTGVDIDEFLSLKPIREKPLLRDSGGKTIVMDETLFVDSITVGPLFMLLLKGDRKQNNLVFSEFGDACHRYSFQLIKRFDDNLPQAVRATDVIHEPKCKHISTSEERSLADVAILAKSSAALLETKGRWFNEKALKGTSAEFLEEIERLYGISIEDGEHKRRGYAQLADVIRLMAEGKVEAVRDAAPIKNVRDIYPVLVVHDTLMHAPKVAHCLALKFAGQFGQATLATAGHFQQNEYRVHSLILTSLHELENFETLIATKPLTEYLAEYSQWDHLRERSLTVFFREKYSGLDQRTGENTMLQRAGMQIYNAINRTWFPSL